MKLHRRWKVEAYLEAFRGTFVAEGTFVGVNTFEAEAIPRCGIGEACVGTIRLDPRGGAELMGNGDAD